MLLITNICKVISPVLAGANLKNFCDLCNAFFYNNYKITTRSLSRYTTCSLRQIFRFLSVSIYCWVSIRFSLFKNHCYDKNKHYILVVDEVVEGKSGKESYGLNKFYSSVAEKSITSVCFFNLSIVETTTKTPYSLALSQVLVTEEDKKRIALAKQKVEEGKKRAEEGETLKKGRKKGTQNKTEKQENNTYSFRAFKDLVEKGTKAIGNNMNIVHLVGDSKYATSDYIDVVAEKKMFLVSKLNNNAALFEIYNPENENTEKKKGRPKKYGEKFDLFNLKQQYYSFSTTDKNGEVEKVYQFQAYSKSILSTKLNVVVIIKTNKEGKKTIAILFSNDLNLDAKNMITYYQARFQIEFEFRDAKQHFGFSDFKNYKKNNLVNFVELIFTICLISKILLQFYRKKLNNEKISVADIKIIHSSQFKAQNIIKYLQLETDNNFYLDKIEQYIPNDIINK